MNFANYARTNARKYRQKICLIERNPSTNQRRELTWAAFNDETNRVANYLKNKLGIRKGDRILHLLNNSIEWIVFYFAIIKLGAVVVPLNFRFVEKDIQFAADISEPVAFILGSEFLERVVSNKQDLDTVRDYIVVGDECPEGMIPYSQILRSNDMEESLLDVNQESDLALMFTSGTTGTAKPVVHTHGSLNAIAIGNGMSVPLEIDDNYTIVLPLYHSGSLFLWTPYYALGATATLVLQCREPKWILEAIDQESGSGVLLVVPLCVDLLNRITASEINIENYDLSSWKYLMTGAQPVPHNIFENLMKFLPCKIIHTYGVTEAGGGVTWTIEDDDILCKQGSIGKPNFGVEGKIVDDKGIELPAESVGELIIRSPRVMKGYFRNKQLTEQSIRDGWFYTGDLARADGEGYYYIVDRKKDMITCGGENIYPVEIEDVLHEHPDIDDAAVIGYPDERLVEIVMAVVQLKRGSSLSVDDIINYCKSKLALYKVPRKVVFDKVPRNPTGKIIKPALRGKYTGEKAAFKLL